MMDCLFVTELSWTFNCSWKLNLKEKDVECSVPDTGMQQYRNLHKTPIRRLSLDPSKKGDTFFF